jgi:hypothetical protein
MRLRDEASEEPGSSRTIGSGPCGSGCGVGSGGGMGRGSGVESGSGIGSCLLRQLEHLEHDSTSNRTYNHACD